MQVESISALESYKVTIVLEEVSKSYHTPQLTLLYTPYVIQILICVHYIVCEKAVVPGLP